MCAVPLGTSSESSRIFSRLWSADPWNPSFSHVRWDEARDRDRQPGPFGQRFCGIFLEDKSHILCVLHPWKSCAWWLAWRSSDEPSACPGVREGLTAALSQRTGGFALHQEPGAGWEIREGRRMGSPGAGGTRAEGPKRGGGTSSPLEVQLCRRKSKDEGLSRGGPRTFSKRHQWGRIRVARGRIRIAREGIFLIFYSG